MKSCCKPNNFTVVSRIGVEIRQVKCNTCERIRTMTEKGSIVIVEGIEQKVISAKSGWVKCCPVSKCDTFENVIENTKNFRASCLSF